MLALLAPDFTIDCRGTKSEGQVRTKYGPIQPIGPYLLVDVAAPCALEPAFPKELPGLSPHAAVSPNPKIEAPTGDYVTAVQPCLPGGLVSGGRIAVPSRVPRHLP